VAMASFLPLERVRPIVWVRARFPRSRTPAGAAANIHDRN
jgi:hypothetical protein